MDYYKLGYESFKSFDKDTSTESFAKIEDFDCYKKWPKEVVEKWSEYRKGYDKARKNYIAKEKLKFYSNSPDFLNFVWYAVNNKIKLGRGCGCCMGDEIIINGNEYLWEDFDLLCEYLSDV